MSAKTVEQGSQTAATPSTRHDPTIRRFIQSHFLYSNDGERE